MVREVWLAAILASAASAAMAERAAAGNLSMHVGADVMVTVSLTSGHYSCGHNADCIFEVPSNAVLDVVASGGSGRQLRWTGCTALAGTNRCRVEMHGRPVQISVR